MSNQLIAEVTIYTTHN